MSMMRKTWRIRLQQMTVAPGDPRRNTAAMLAAIETAGRDGVHLLVFPEMAVPGYLLGDEWERPAFLRESLECGEIVRDAARHVTVVYGNLAVDCERRNEDGRVRKYNALYVASQGRLAVPQNGLGYPFVPKTLMPNYRLFDDSRHFFDARKLAMERRTPLADLLVPVEIDGHQVGLMLCEDAWDADYDSEPSRILAAKGAELLIDISCSPFTVNKKSKRDRVFSTLANELRRTVLYVNAIGIQDIGKTVYTFDGGSAVYAPNGVVLTGPPDFTEGALTLDWPLSDSYHCSRRSLDDIADIDRALVYGIGGFRERLGLRRVVVGISGGIDSAVVAALHSRVFAPPDLMLLSMPSRFNSDLTRKLSRQLADSLGSLFAEIPIDESVALTQRQLDGLEFRSADGSLRTILELNEGLLENVQARDRSSRLLAAVAAAFGGVFTCNANKVEMSAGYTTLYGDLGGYLAPIGDLWKHEVYRLADYMNKFVFGAEIVPAGCMTVTPSAELSCSQNVDRNLGDPFCYPYHDALFRAWVETWDRLTPEEMILWYRDGELAQRIGFDGDLQDLFPTSLAFVNDLESCWNAYQGLGVAKRIQAPPVLAVKRRAFGFDHREAQLGSRYTRRYFELKQALLS